MAEIRRVLRPGGGLALLWNGRDLADEKHARLDELLAPHRQEFPSSSEQLQPFLGPSEHRTWCFTQALTLDEYVDRVASTSFVGAMSSERRREFLTEIRDALSPFDEPHELRYLTDVYVWDAVAANSPNEGSSATG